RRSSLGTLLHLGHCFTWDTASLGTLLHLGHCISWDAASVRTSHISARMATPQHIGHRRIYACARRLQDARSHSNFTIGWQLYPGVEGPGRGGTVTPQERYPRLPCRVPRG